jgi:glycosyltransferase involved in cell wall biosynthesis
MMKTVDELIAPVMFDDIPNDRKATKPFVSVVVPAYNEAAIMQKNLVRLCEYMESLEDRYRWEIIFVNDGSTDGTGELAEAFARTRENVYVLHHARNMRLGHALRFAFEHCRGDYVVTMDIDLSYSPDHIARLLTAIREGGAKIAIASPYMMGGKVSHVPWTRRILSRWANRYLSFAAKGKWHTLTGMVRAYDRRFLNNLDLSATDVEINTEILFKAQLLKARVVEIPAHLDWSLQKAAGASRRSSMKILRAVMSYLFSGFIFRPVIFFILPGFVLMLLSLYPISWVFIHTSEHLEKVPSWVQSFDSRLSAAVAGAFHEFPHTFFVAGMALMVAIQLISLGIVSMQSKRYFEELFHLGTSIYRYDRENGKWR